MRTLGLLGFLFGLYGLFSIVSDVYDRRFASVLPVAAPAPQQTQQQNNEPAPRFRCGDGTITDTVLIFTPATEPTAFCAHELRDALKLIAPIARPVIEAEKAVGGAQGQ